MKFKKSKTIIEVFSDEKYYYIPGPPAFFPAYCPICGALFNLPSGIWRYFSERKKVLCCPNCENKPITNIDEKRLVEIKGNR